MFSELFKTETISGISLKALNVSSLWISISGYFELRVTIVLLENDKNLEAI